MEETVGGIIVMLIMGLCFSAFLCCGSGGASLGCHAGQEIVKTLSK